MAEERQPSPEQRGSRARTAGIFLQTPRWGGGDVAVGFTLSDNNRLNEQKTTRSYRCSSKSQRPGNLLNRAMNEAFKQILVLESRDDFHLANIKHEDWERTEYATNLRCTIQSIKLKHIEHSRLHNREQGVRQRGRKREVQQAHSSAFL